MNKLQKNELRKDQEKLRTRKNMGKTMKSIATNIKKLRKTRKSSENHSKNIWGHLLNTGAKKKGGNFIRPQESRTGLREARDSRHSAAVAREKE